MIAVYYIAFFLGLLPGYFINRHLLARTAYWIMIVSGNILIALFGIQMSSAPEIGGALLADLLSSWLIALLAVTGSVIVTFIFIRVWRNRLFPSGEDRPVLDSSVKNRRGWLPTAVSLCLLVAGLAIGTQLASTDVARFLRGPLLIMIVAVGLQSGHELHTIGRVKGRRLAANQVLLMLVGLPVSVIIGTLLFSASAGLFLNQKWSDCMLCAAPMGWQTLGGPLVLELRGVRLGNIAFMTNMFRDVIALLAIPLVSRGRYRLLSVSPGCVSTMDILLPGIIATSGRHNLIYAMWVGACCSFWAPILIHLIAKVSS